MEQAIEDANGTNNPRIDTADVDVVADRADNPGIDIKRVTSNNGNDNSKIRCSKFVSFSINNITNQDYSIQLTTKIMKLMKNLLGINQLKATRTTMAIIRLIPDILNFISFLSTIDQVILSNLQLQ